MLRSISLGLIGLIVSVSAQTSTESAPSSTITSIATLSTSATSSTSSSSESAEPRTHTIQVGQGGFRFTPAEIKNVSAGDTVTFEFFPPDHSVARAEFGSACVPYEYSGKNKVGFFSEQKNFTDMNEVGKHNWDLKINDTDPIFFYCTAPNSCIGELMVGVINPTEEKTLQKQLDYARTADYQLAPGDEIPSEADQNLSKPGSGGASSGSQDSGDDDGLSAGAIAGIVVGSVAFLAICGALFFYVGRTKSLKEIMKRHDATSKHQSGVPGAGPDGAYAAPGTPGFAPATPFSPNQSVAEYGGPPMYSPGQHAIDARESGHWSQPAGGQHPGHLSVGSQPAGVSEYKPFNHPHASVASHEMPSPDPNRETFTAELEAPIKSPRN